MKKLAFILAFSLITGCASQTIPQKEVSTEEIVETEEISQKTENNDVLEQQDEQNIEEESTKTEENLETEQTEEPLATEQEQVEVYDPRAPKYTDEELAALLPVLDINDKFYDLKVVPPQNPQKAEAKTMYLTFDDGPSERTIEVLDILKKYDVKGTFFVTSQVESQRTPEAIAILNRIVDEGHTIAVHTYSHDYREIYASVDAYLNDFNKMFNFIKENTGVTPDIFRFAGGSVNGFNKKTRKDIISEMTKRGFVYFDWNVLTNDAAGSKTPRDATTSFKETLGSKERAFVLMHDSQKMDITVDVLEYLIIYSMAEGYSFEKLTNEVYPSQF